MSLRAAPLITLALIGLLPLILSTHVNDVFFTPWRAGLCVWLGFLLTLTAADWIRGRSRPALSASQLPWLLFALWALAAAAWSTNPGDSLRRACELAGAVAALWLGLAGASRWPRLAGVAILAVVLSSLYAAAQVAGLDPLPWSTRFGRRAFGTLGNPDYYAGHLLVVVPILLAGLMEGGGKRESGTPAVIRIAAAGLLTAGLLLSQVRGAWLAAGATAGFAAWYLWRDGLGPAERRRLLRFAAAAAGLFLTTVALSADVRGRFSSMFAFGGYDATGRRYLWTVAAHIFRERPLTGFGTDGFKFEFPRYQHLGIGFDPVRRAYNHSTHAHNELLQFGAELGLIGLGLFVWGLLAWWLKWNRRLRELAQEGKRREWWKQLGMGTGLAGALAYSVVNFPFQVVPTAFLWWFTLGASLGRQGGSEPRTLLPRPLATAAGLGLIVICAAASFLNLRDLVGSGYHKNLRVLGQIGKWRSAVFYGIKAGAVLPHEYDVQRWLSKVAIEIKEEELAESAIQRRLDLHPYLADALLDRARLSRNLERLDEALTRYKHVLEVAPNYAAAWGEMGKIHYQRGNIELAAEAFGKASYFQPGDAEWPHNQAAALGMLKLYERALEADREAIRRDPKFLEAYLTYALSAQFLGRRDEAREAAAEAYSLQPDDPRVKTLLRQLSRPQK